MDDMSACAGAARPDQRAGIGDGYGTSVPMDEKSAGADAARPDQTAGIADGNGTSVPMDEKSASAGMARPDPRAGNGEGSGTSFPMDEKPASAGVARPDPRAGNGDGGGTKFPMDEMSASAGAARPDPRAGSGGDNGTSIPIDEIPELPDSFLTLKNLRRIAVASKVCLQGAEEFLGVSDHDPASCQHAAEEDREPDTGWASMNEISASVEAPKMPPAAYLRFVREKRASLKGSVVEVAASLRKLWSEMDPIEKQALEETAKAEMETYLNDK
jgi:hypothetical protein